MLLSADAGRNVIFAYHPVLQRSGFDLGKRSNLITSLREDNPAYVWNDSAENNKRDKWFRPSDVAIGTDGAIYVADWYDPVVGGHQMKDTKGYGRIYRIAPKGFKLTTPRIDLHTMEGQLLALKSPAVNVRNAGFLKLKEQGENAVSGVKRLLNDQNPFIRARATYLLAQLGEKGKAEVDSLLKNNDAQLRAAAYRALREVLSDILPYAIRMAADTSAFVRREVAISLKGMPFNKTKEVVTTLIKGYDGADKWYLETLGAVLEGHESGIYPVVKSVVAPGLKPAQWNRQMASLAWRLHPPEAVQDLKERAGDSLLQGKEREDALTALAFIRDPAAANAMIALSGSKLNDVSEQATYWLSFRQSNDWYNLINWNKVNVNTGYERKLAEMKVKRQIILDESQPPDERRRRVTDMARDSVGGQLLIALAADRRLPQQLLPFIEEFIFKNPDPGVRIQAANYFKKAGVSKTYSIKSIENFPADAARGKAVFSLRCASCHKFGGDGNNIGPDLAGIGKKFSRQELLDAIINPSAAIVFGYEPWLIETKDGGSFFGFLISQNEQTAVIKDISGQKHIIPVNTIAAKKRQEQSLMPEPENNGLTEQNLADIAAFLLSPEKNHQGNNIDLPRK